MIQTRGIANSNLESQPAVLADFLYVGDAADIARRVNAEPVVIAPKHVDQQLDHRVAHQLLTGAFAQSPVYQLVVNNIQELDSGRVQHHSCSGEFFTDAVPQDSRFSLKHT